MRFKAQSPVAPFRLTLAAALVSSFSASLHAQDPEPEPVLEEVIVTGIRASLAGALNQQRDSDNLVSIIQAEDIGKLPDQNLAEVLENIPGVQITRTAGVGSGVQIRGTNANRTEINGVSTTGSGTGRTGIDFEDVSASIIAGIEVVKAAEAKTIEGSVGGTINLKTIRPLDLDAPLIATRLQGEHSSLDSDDDINPRVSGTFGNNWDTSEYGSFGAVGSISYTEQSTRAFRPRADRDNYVAAGDNPSADFHYLPTQFFVQDYDNYERETTVFAGTFEWAPNEDWRFYFDAVYSDQDEEQESSRVQTSGISTQRNVANITEFETVNFGSLNGRNGTQNLGSIDAAVRGVIPAQNDDRFDPNLRLSTDTNSRDSENEIYSLGGDWNRDNWRVGVEVSTSENETTTPNFLSTLNFINPNTAVGANNENGTPIEFDLTDGLTFGIAEGEANAPTTEQLLNPANYRLRDVNQTQDEAENQEDAFRIDVSYFFEDVPVLTSIDVGYRYNETTSYQNQVRSNYGIRTMDDSPAGDLYAEVLTAGPDNFDDADGRDLYFPHFLVIDPGQANSNPGGVVDVLNAAIAEHQANTGSTEGGIDSPTSLTSGFFDIEEETDAFYAQANFEWRMFRGNVGVRYLDTTVESTGNTVTNDVVTQSTSKGDYDFWLPRINLVANITEDIVVRAAYGEDIRRPDFDDLSTSFTFDTSPNPAVELGNPALVPEEVESYDIGVEWYFAPRAVVSVGYFNKDRKGLFTRQDSDPVEDANGFRDTTPPCEEGGIFNPIADPNVFAPPGTPPGVCVPTSQVINGTGETTQDGWEISFQYDLGAFEDRLGWASGFGIIANYTTQEFDGSGQDFYSAFSRPTTVFNALGATETVTMEVPLLDLSEDAYNVTAYYEKYGLSARVRYTWRDEHRSDDFGSTSSFPWGFPVVQDDRKQINASIAYEVNDNFSLLLEAINITEEEIEQYCVNGGALLCYEGLTDRRITFGVAYRM